MKKVVKIICLAILLCTAFSIANGIVSIKGSNRKGGETAYVDCGKSNDDDKNVCKAISVFDMVSPKIIDFYESEIAGEKVVSDKSAKQIENIAQKYSISDKKAQGVLIVYDFCKRTGGGMDFPTIAKMTDGKIIALVKARAKVYEQSISEEKKADLKRKSKEILGISI